jgi:integrase
MRADGYQMAAARFLQSVRETRTKGTVQSYETILRGLHRAMRRAGVSGDLRRWEAADIAAIFQQRGHILPGTMRLEMTVLRGMLKHRGLDVMERALRERRLHFPPRSRVRVRWHTDDIIARARAEARSDAEYLMVVLMSELGMRRASVADLRLGDIVGDTMSFLAKGGKVVTVPITPSVQTEMDRWLMVRAEMIRKHPGQTVPLELLIHARYNRLSRYCPDTITEMMAALGRRIGVKLSPHDLRRSCGRELYRATHDLLAVSVLLGHSDPKTTMDYIGLDSMLVRDALMVRETAKSAPRQIPWRPLK